MMNRTVKTADVLSEAVGLSDRADFKQSQRRFEAMLQSDPTSDQAWLGLAALHQRSGNLAAAVNTYRQFLRIRPRCAEALTNLGLICQELGDRSLAIELHREAIRVSPGLADAHNNLGSAFSQQGNLQEARVHFRRALSLQPKHPAALYNMGYLSELQGDWSTAKIFIEAALDADPNSDTFRFNLSTLSLLQGDYAKGWRGYEHRWRTCAFQNWRRDFTQAQWNGEPLCGRWILLHAEQGLGDTMQFIRYVPLVADKGGRVILEVPPSLRRLLERTRGIEKIVSRGEPLPYFDVHCPLMSLPLAFGTEVATIPQNIPYISASISDTESWSHSIPPSKLRVGIAWGGNPKHPREHLRAIPLSEFGNLLGLDDVLFISLQKGRAAEQLVTLPEWQRPLNIESEQGDFADTAAVVANLDLVISIDTSVAHLAGAMGKRVWILLSHAPDWRWLTGRNDSPWYPTARLFRKSVGEDWSAVVRRIQAELCMIRDQRCPEPQLP